MRANLVVSALFLLATLAVADTTRQPQAGWKEFTPKDKSFSVWLPEKGGKRYERERTIFVNGMRLKFNLVELELNDGPTLNAYTIIMPLQLARKISPQQRIEIFRDAIVKDVTGKIDEEKDIKQGKVPGKEYTIKTGQGLVRLRLFALGGRIYQASAKGTKDQVESKDVETFLDSYKLPSVATDDDPKPEKNNPKVPDPKSPDQSKGDGKAPAWTVDLAKMAFPEGSASGTLLGQPFTVESAKLEPSGALVLRQGKTGVPDPAILIFLKPGQSVEGKSFEISKDTAATDRPHIHLKRKNTAQAHVLNYSMRLEFGKAMDGVITGRIYVCLPDTGKSVVAGTFSLKAP